MFIPNLRHANFRQLGVQVHQQEEETMPKMGPSSNPGFLWCTDHFHSIGCFILGKPRSSDRRDCIASDTCLSLFHVDLDQETSTVWCRVNSQFGTRLFRYYTQCPVSRCSSVENSGQRHRCQVLPHSITTYIEAKVITPWKVHIPSIVLARTRMNMKAEEKTKKISMQEESKCTIMEKSIPRRQ